MRADIYRGKQTNDILQDVHINKVDNKSYVGAALYLEFVHFNSSPCIDGGCILKNKETYFRCKAVFICNMLCKLSLITITRTCLKRHYCCNKHHLFNSK